MKQRLHLCAHTLSKCVYQVTEPMDLRGFDAQKYMPSDALGGHVTFVNTAALHVGKLHGDSQAVATMDPYGGLLSNPLDMAASSFLKGLMPSRQPPKTHLDVRTKLNECTLVGLHHRCVPDTEAAGYIAVKRKLFKEQYRVGKPFVYVELHKFLPQWCKNRGEGEADESSKQRLTLLQWVVAFDRYAIAATVAGELSYTSAAAHKDVVLQVCNCCLGQQAICV